MMQAQKFHRDLISNDPAIDIKIIVPCYNEAQRLVPDAFIAFAQQNPHIGFVFVDDGSTDNTRDVLARLVDAAPKQITALILAHNSGKAEAVRAGLQHASETGAVILGYWDADLATPLSEICDLAQIAVKNPKAEVVFASRYRMLGQTIHRPLSRRLVSMVGAMMARTALHMPVQDTQCGAKLFRNSPRLKAALSRPFRSRWVFDVELFLRLAIDMPDKRAGFHEHAIKTWQEVPGSNVTLSAVFRSGWEMLGLVAMAQLQAFRGLLGAPFGQKV